MTATVYRDRESGFFRAVCRDEACRAANRQRTYWRTGHSSEVSARADANIHNRQHHSEQMGSSA